MKLAVFDLDGTIIGTITNFWKFICEEHGCDMEKKEQAYQNYYKNLITYDEWVTHDVGLWIEKGVTKQKLVDSIKKLEVMPGAIETIKELKKRGIKVGIISDSLDIALQCLIPDSEELFDDIMVNKLFFDDEGNISGWEPTPYGIEKKADGLKEIAKREGFDLKECVFVGDGRNDANAVRIAGLGISFNSSSEELDKAADVVIKNKDMREILKHI